MRILIATGIYPPEVGGPATYAKLLHEKLSARGFILQVLPFSDVRKYPKLLRHVLYFFCVFKQGLKSDLIFTQDPVSTGLPSLFAAKLLRKPLVLRVAGDYAWEQSVQRYGVKDTIDDFQNKKYGWRVELLRFLETFTVKHATSVVAPSDYFKSLVAGWTKGTRPVQRIYNGVDLAVSFTPGERYNTPTLITAGRLVSWKGIDTLIKLLTKLPDWNLVIAGDGPERKNLEDLVLAHNLGARVAFKGNLARTELFSEIAKSHIFVLNTSFESFSFQIVEAMYVGTPVIATTVGNIPEIIKSGVSGLLVSPNDTEGIIKAVHALKDDRKFRENIVRDGKIAAQNFSVNATIAALVELFQSVVQTALSSSGVHRLSVLMISTDRKIFEKESSVHARMAEYGKYLELLHSIVFTKREQGFSREQLAANVFAHPTNSWNKLLYIYGAISCARALKRQGIHIDVVTTQDPFESGVAGWWIARMFKAKLHIQIHTDVMSPYFARESLLNRIRVQIAKFLIPRAHGIRVVSNRIKKTVEPLAKKGTPITVLPILVGTTQNLVQEQGTDIRKKFVQFDFLALIVARLTREKNIESAIEAMALVIKNKPRAALVIVGDGPQKADLKKLAQRLGIGEQVIFEGWQNNPQPYYKAVDVLVVSSFYEGYGLTVIEALHAGCPVVMTDVGCAGEVIQDGKNGLVVPVGDTVALAGAIDTIALGGPKFEAKMPSLPTSEDYMIGYAESLESAVWRKR